MQKTIKIGSIFYLCLLCLTVNAQEEKNPDAVAEKKNIIKVNLPTLAFRNFSLQYERQVGRRTSVAVHVHTMPFGKLPFQSTIESLNDDVDVQFDKFQIGSFGIVPEFRYYVGKKGALRGFYIGPFLNYSSYKMDLPIEYNNKTGIFNGKLNAITGGLQIGSQFRLSNSLTLDWWILGPNYGSADGTLTFTGALTATEQQELSDALEDIKNNAPLKTIKSYTVNNNGATVFAKGPWGGLRGLGFNLGFRF